MPEKSYLPESGKINLNNVNNRDDPFSNPDSQSPTVNPNIVETPVVQEDSPNEVVSREPEVSAGSSDNIPPEDKTDSGFLGGSQRAMGIVAIILGLLIMGGGYIAYKYFTRDDAQLRDIPIAEVQNDESDSDSIVDDLNGRIAGGVSTSRAEDWEVPGDSFGIVQGESSDSSDIAEVPVTPTARNSVPLAQSGQHTQDETDNLKSVWRANDYTRGDIKAGTYNVVRGDTLWEISEGVYGSGSQWQEIATANNVSYLSNGNPLILPGQVLNIPS